MRVYKDIQVAELSALNCKQVGNRCNEIDSRDARDLTGRVIREQTHGWRQNGRFERLARAQLQC